MTQTLNLDKMSMSRALLSFVLVACSLMVMPALADHADDHPSCGCLAFTLGFTINCNARSLILNAFNALSSCSVNCSLAGNSCYRNYAIVQVITVTRVHYDLYCLHSHYGHLKELRTYGIVQAHHDFCPPSALPVEVELGFHVYDDLCGEACFVGRQFVPGLPACPAAQCSNTAGYTSAVNTLDASCTSSCSSPACSAAYRTVRATHDGCDEIPEAIEVAIHNFEDVCAAQECNVVTQAFDPNICGTSPISGPTTPIVTPNSDAAGRLFATDNIDNQVTAPRGPRVRGCACVRQ